MALRYRFDCATIVADSAIELHEICFPHTYILCSFALFFYPFLNLDSHRQIIPQQSKIYFNFKDFVELENIQTEPLLMEMLAYAKRYQILLDGKTGSTALDACISRLNRLETTVTRTFFLEVLRLYDEKKLTLAQVTEAWYSISGMKMN